MPNISRILSRRLRRHRCCTLDAALCKTFLAAQAKGVSMTEALRVLNIKSGVVRRLTKDVAYALKESESERQRLSKLQADNGDEYEIRAQEKVIADADQMIPDYRKRLHSAVSELTELLKSPDIQAIAASDLDTTNKILEAAKAQL